MLTEIQCKNATCAEGKARARFADSGGLYLEVSASGSKRWFWKYRFGGKEKRLSLGAYPATKLKEARMARDEAKRLHHEGTDPSQRRKLDRAMARVAVVIDLFSRQVMGRSLRRDMTHSIVIDALRMAWFKRHPDKGGGLIFHSDRAASTPAASSGLCWPSTASPVQFNEPQGQLLGQRLQRDVVWLAQGRAPARAAL